MVKSVSDDSQLGFYFDASRCNGCKACHVACKDGRNLPMSTNFRRVFEYGGGSFSLNPDGTVDQSVFAYYASVSCNHCANPACTDACPTGAMHKRDDGLVSVHEEICIGCASCAEACPYGAPQLDAARQKMTKCDGCHQRLAFGMKPLCTEACTQRALDFGTLAELRSRYPQASDTHFAPLPSPSITGPCLLVKPANNAQPIGSHNGSVLNPNEL